MARCGRLPSGESFRFHFQLLRQNASNHRLHLLLHLANLILCDPRDRPIQSRHTPTSLIRFRKLCE